MTSPTADVFPVLTQTGAEKRALALKAELETAGWTVKITVEDFEGIRLRDLDLWVSPSTRRVCLQATRAWYEESYIVFWRSVTEGAPRTTCFTSASIIFASSHPARRVDWKHLGYWLQGAMKPMFPTSTTAPEEETP